MSTNIHLKYNYNTQIFYQEDEISYYLLGAFITDGCVYKNNPTTYACQLSSCNKDWLDTIKDVIGTNLKLHKFKENYYGIRIIRKEIAQWFIDHGCLPQKTLNITLPNIPDIYMKDFLRGCIDGDGSIGTYQNKNYYKRTCSLISASLIFLEKIKLYLTSKDISSTIIEKRQNKPSIVNGKPIIQKYPCYSLNTYGKNAYKFLKLIYYPNHKLSLSRKLNLAQQIIDFYEKSEITDKRKIRKLNINTKINWLPDNELINLINKSNVEQVAKQLGVHGTTIRNRLKKRGIYDKIIKHTHNNFSTKQIIQFHFV